MCSERDGFVSQAAKLTPFAVQRLLLSKCDPRALARERWEGVTTDNDRRVRRISDWDDIGRDTEDFTPHLCLQ